jgi:hypothetical protein
VRVCGLRLCGFDEFPLEFGQRSQRAIEERKPSNGSKREIA